MNSQVPNSTIGLLFSGGLDSCILLADLLRRGRSVQPLLIRSELVWHREEFRAAERFLAATASPRLHELVVLDLPLADLYEDHWSITGRNPPDATSADEAVYMPGRNALLMIKAALWCQLHGIEELALAVLGTSPFADARSAFFHDLESALNRAPLGAPLGPIRFPRPFAGTNKRQVMELGRGLPLELTFSCIAPVDDLHCGLCNKCAERKAAFQIVGLEDPTRYAADSSETARLSSS